MPHPSKRLGAESEAVKMDGTRRRTQVNPGEVCLLVLLDYRKRPVMNLHNVPLSAEIGKIKGKISERLSEIGKFISPERL